MQIKIDASPSEVLLTLSEGLSSEELDMLAVQPGRRDPFVPNSHNDLPELRTVVEFAALAVVSGTVHDIAKGSARKALDLLKARFKEKVRAQDDDVDK